MKKINLFFIILLFFLSLLLAGCIPGGQQKGPLEVDYHTGISGLEMSFVKNLPPSEVWEGADFTISVELKNIGAHDIEKGMLSITNILEDYVYISDKEVPFRIRGRGIEYPDGGYGVINFNLKNKAMPEGKKEFDLPFRIIAEYDYTTEATAQVCISPWIYTYQENKEAACKPGTIEFKSGQGAPVTVTKIEQITRPYGDYEIEMGFKITVGNQGDGDILENVEVEDVALNYNYLSCVPSSFKIEKGKSESFTCSIVMNKEEGAYLSPLMIRLNYNYVEYLDKKVKIKKLEALE